MQALLDNIPHTVDMLVLKGAEQGSEENEKGKREQNQSQGNSLEDDTIAYTAQSHARTHATTTLTEPTRAHTKVILMHPESMYIPTGSLHASPPDHWTTGSASAQSVLHILLSRRCSLKARP